MNAQSRLKGFVCDTANRPLSLASIILLQDSVFIYGTTADGKGIFNLSYPNQPGKTYQLSVSLAGYHSFNKYFVYPDTGFFRQIILQEDKRMLSGVTVTSTKPLLTRRADRYIVNVENSFLANGNSGLDVLQRSPGVWVDSKGNIRLKGTHPVMVMINDVVQRMSDEELADYLRSMKSEDISRIEIIHNPPAEFEASGPGGIIHIILKKERRDGLNGSLNAQYRQQGHRSNLNSGAAVNLKFRNYYFTGSATLSKDSRYIFEKAAIIHPGDSYSNQTDRIEKGRNRQYRLGLNYDMNGCHSFGIQTMITRGRFPQFFTTTEQFLMNGQASAGISATEKFRKLGLSSTTFNYQWRIDSSGASLKLVSDYTDSYREENNDFRYSYSDPSRNSLSRNGINFTTKVRSIQSDYTKPFGTKTTITVGIKYVSIRRNSILLFEDYLGNDWQVNDHKSNQFIYSERLFMLYSTIERSIKNTSIKLGLRSEHTRSDGNSITLSQQFRKNYPGLFPSLFIMQTLNGQMGTAIFANYSRRLTRPALSDLNPARVVFNSYTAMKGNPELMPQYTHNLGVGYKLTNDFSADAYYSRTIDAISLSANPGADNFIDYISENVGRITEYGITVNAAFAVMKGWRSNNNFTLWHSSYSFNAIPYRQTAVYLKSIQTLIIKNIMDIDIIADYRSPTVYTNLRNPSLFYFDLGFSRRLFKGKGQLRLYFADLFNTMREKELTEENNTRIEFYRKRPTRTVALSIRYNFNVGKIFNTRRLEQGNTEERSRINN